MSDQPTTRRATFPPDYGARGGEGDDPAAWAAIEDKLRAAPNYWVTTISPDGRPHARPVDGVWVEGALVFGGSPDTRWVRNLQQNPALSVHLPSGDDVVILEGDVELVMEADHPLSEPSRAGAARQVPAVLPRGARAPAVLDAPPDGRLRLDARGLPQGRHPVDLRHLGSQSGATADVPQHAAFAPRTVDPGHAPGGVQATVCRTRPRRTLLSGCSTRGESQ